MIKFEGELNTDLANANNNPTMEKDIEKSTPLSADGNDAKEKKNNRGSYRCSRCNIPKKGHVCPYQAIIRKRETVPNQFVDMEVQVEMDSEMTVAKLGPLQLQGSAESYLLICPTVLPNHLLLPGVLYDEELMRKNEQY